MYVANTNRYDNTIYNRCGRSGLVLPRISLGMWQNFGKNADYDTMKDIILTAFDHGITYFDLANNYGPDPGQAEINFGKIFNENLKPYRDEIIIATKAGYEMWPGPYGGRGGSRKYLTASLDQSLKRMGIDYVDIFYHHCLDPDTPLKETALCMSDIVRQGKSLYIGMSNYDGKKMHRMYHKCDDYNVPFVVNQNRYNILDRQVEYKSVSVSTRDLLRFLRLRRADCQTSLKTVFPSRHAFTASLIIAKALDLMMRNFNISRRFAKSRTKGAKPFLKWRFSGC